jgi:hypothetical protein
MPSLSDKPVSVKKGFVSSSSLSPLPLSPSPSPSSLPLLLAITTAKKVGDDLEVALEEGVIIFDNYFAVCATDLSCLVSLPTEDGGLHHIVADVSFTLEDGTQIVYFYGDRSLAQ